MTGGASVHYHMVNENSLNYFKRVIAMSSSGFSSYALREANHVEEIQECTQIYDMNELITYLKTAPSNAFDECYPWTSPDGLHPIWVPTIEPTYATDAFLTKLLDKFYSLGEAPNMDVMFSFTPEVCLFKLRRIIINNQ